MDGIMEERERLLRRLAGEAKRQSRFYAAKWKGFDPGVDEPGFSITSLPFTDRAEISACDPFDLLWKDRKQVQAYYESSGTTGSPTPGFPDLSFEKAAAFGRFLDQWMCLTQHRIRKAAVGLAFEMNPTGIRFQMALPTLGITVFPIGARSTICPPERQIDVLKRMGPQAIFGRPMEILRLADANLELGGGPGDFQVVKLFFTGEIVSPAKWRRMSEAWEGAEVYGHYGLTEIDSGLQTCAEMRYHEPTTPFLVTEVIEEGCTGAVPDGSLGEFVLTSLRMESMPLFRYRTQDLGFRHPDACPCGSRTPSYTIKGRRSDFLAHGTAGVFPIDLEDAVLGEPAIGNEYQFQILSGETVRLILEKRWGNTEASNTVARRVAGRLRKSLGLKAEVRVLEFGALADKLGIAKAKSGNFQDLRGREPADGDGAVPEINCIDRSGLRTQRGKPLSI